MMNKLRDFILSNKVFSKCSEQEQEEIVSELERVKKIEKALDDACEELASMDYKLNMNSSLFAYDCDYKDSREWKKELLK